MILAGEAARENIRKPILPETVFLGGQAVHFDIRSRADDDCYTTSMQNSTRLMSTASVNARPIFVHIGSLSFPNDSHANSRQPGRTP